MAKWGKANVTRADASKLTIGIAVARFNEGITEALLEAAKTELRSWKVKEAHIHVVRVAGSFELPLAALQLFRTKKADAVIALGCIVKGKTKHDEYLALSVFHALHYVSLNIQKPIGLGILTVNSIAEAKRRIEYASAAVSAALGAALI